MKKLILLAALALAGCDFGSTRVDSEARQKMPVNVNDRVTGCEDSGVQG